MKKQDIVILAVLFGLWIAWPTVDRQIKKFFFQEPIGPTAEPVKSEESDRKPAALVESKITKPVLLEAPLETPVAPAVAEETAPLVPEKTTILENEKLKVTVSSATTSPLSWT